MLEKRTKFLYVVLPDNPEEEIYFGKYELLSDEKPKNCVRADIILSGGKKSKLLEKDEIKTIREEYKKFKKEKLEAQADII